MKERVDEFKEYRVYPNGMIWSHRRNKMLKSSLVKGYRQIELNICGVVHKRQVHRLVASKYLENPLHKPQINHKNGAKSDNRLSNLEWVTQSENALHSFATGLQQPLVGEQHGMCKLTTAEVLQIRALAAKGVAQCEIAKLYKVGKMQCSRIINRKRWKHI